MLVIQERAIGLQICLGEAARDEAVLVANALVESRGQISADLLVLLSSLDEAVCIPNHPSLKTSAIMNDARARGHSSTPNWGTLIRFNHYPPIRINRLPKRLACNGALDPHPLHTYSRGRFSQHTRGFLPCVRHECCTTRGM